MTNSNDLYKVRAAKETDIPQILDIYNERILNSTSLFMYDQVSLDNRLTWFMETKAKGYPMIVAAEKETDKAVAYACLGGFRPHTAYVLTTEISIYVNQDHQRKGLGVLLLKEILRIGTEMGFKNIQACITSENEVSIGLFSKYGFKHAGHLKNVGYKFGRFLDVVFLEYITDVNVGEDQRVPAFRPFPWKSYAYTEKLYEN